MTEEQKIPPSPFELGKKALKEGRTADALHSFEQAYHLNPHDARLHEEIGKLYFAQGNLRRAREYMQYSLHLDPNAPATNYQLAQVALQDGKTDEAVRLLRRTLQLDPEHEGARAVFQQEEQRARISQRLSQWQPRRKLGEEVVLRPPRQVGPDGRERPAPLRAPHHCINCFFRAGRHPRRMYASRRNWWNLGLVGLLFGGWLVYLIWTYAARERKFSFEPLYCPVCNSNRAMLSWGFWGLMVMAPIFALAATIATSTVSSWGGPASSSAYLQLVFPLVLWALCVGCVLLALLARRRDARQVGVKLRPLGDEDAGFAFLSPQYAEAFSQLNGAFVRREPVTDEHAEADSFLPGAAAEVAAPFEPAAEEPPDPPELPPRETPPPGPAD